MYLLRRFFGGRLLVLVTHLQMLRLLAVSLACVIAWLTLTPWVADLPAVRFGYIDKLEHAGAFLLLVALATLAWWRSAWGSCSSPHSSAEP